MATYPGVLEDLRALSELAAHFNGRLLLHPYFDQTLTDVNGRPFRLFPELPYEIGPAPDDALVRRAIFDPSVVLVGVGRFGNWGSRSFKPRTPIPLARLGRLQAVFVHGNQPAHFVLIGPEKLRRGFRTIKDGGLVVSEPRLVEIPNEEQPFLSEDGAWELCEELEAARRVRSEETKRGAEAKRLADEAAKAEDRRLFREESRLWALQPRVTVSAPDPLYGDLLLRVVTDDGVTTARATEYRHLPDGTVVFLEFADEDGRGGADEPLHRTKFQSFEEALAANFVPCERDPEEYCMRLERGLSLDELAAAFKAAEIPRTYFLMRHGPVMRHGLGFEDSLGFDGDDIVNWRIAEGTELFEIEQELRIVWKFHCGVETSGPWVREYYEVIGENNGIYYYIDSGDGDGYLSKLGRFEDDAVAISAGIERSGMTEAERAEIFASSEEGAETDE